MLRSQHCFVKRYANRGKSESSSLKIERSQSLGCYDEVAFQRDMKFITENKMNINKFLKYLVMSKEISEFMTFCVCKQLNHFVEVSAKDFTVLGKLFQTVAEIGHLQIIIDYLKDYLKEAVSDDVYSYTDLIDLIIDLIKMPLLETITIHLLSKMLMWLSVSDDNLKYFHTNNIVPAILGMMTAYHDVPSVQTNAATVLSNVALSIFDDVQFPIRPSCLEILMLSIKTHNTKMPIVRPCLEVFYNTYFTLNRYALREMKKAEDRVVAAHLKIQQCYNTLRFMQENCLVMIEECAQQDHMDEDLASDLYSMLSYFRDDNPDFLKIKQMSEMDVQFSRKGILKTNIKTTAPINDSIDDYSYDFCDVKCGASKVAFVL